MRCTFSAAQPRVLDELEKIVAALFPDQFADERAEHADVIPQGLVLVLERDVLATRGLVDASIHEFAAGRSQSRKFSY
jgi:hypothetical protein